MPDLLANASRWLTEQRRLHLRTDVVWSRGATSVTVPATVGRTTFATESATGRVESHQSRDYVVAVADLPVEPREGDRIAETFGDAVHLHEVMAPGGAPAVEWADAARSAWRLHTKFVGRQA